MRTIAKLFRDVEFTDEEQRLVEDAGRKLAELSFETLVHSTEVTEMRPFAVLFAMAALLGNHPIVRDGVPALRDLPPNDAG